MCQSYKGGRGLGRNQHHWNTIGDPRSHIIGDPRISIGDPQAFHKKSQSFRQRPPHFIEEQGSPIKILRSPMRGGSLIVLPPMM